MEKLIKKLRSYAEAYREPPFGREIEGTLELFEQAAAELENMTEMKKRFLDGIGVHYQGNDAEDGIECPICGNEVARNDDYPEMMPRHCPECGTKLIY